MSEQRSESNASGVRHWCDRMAGLAADALVDAGLLGKADFERAVAVLSEELLARLGLDDYPPTSGPPGS